MGRPGDLPHWEPAPLDVNVEDKVSNLNEPARPVAPLA